MSSKTSTKEIDPLLRDLDEKKLNFRRNVVSLAAELKDVRSRLSSQEESFAKESLTRQVRVLGFWFDNLSQKEFYLFYLVVRLNIHRS